MRLGFPLDDIAAITKYDPWFLGEIATILTTESEIKTNGLPKDEAGMRRLKSMGFSDARLAKLTGQKEKDVHAARIALGVRPVFKRIDTCAAEFAALTPYMYSTYESPIGGTVECESRPTDKKKIIILGGGPNRIGQGIEFDYCCCHAAFALSARGFETIMVNCNPETVSTDYDTSDRLYFEPLTAEDVLEIVRIEQSKGTLAGVIVQFGGQTPLKLANMLVEAGVPILGTSADAIDLAEDRKRFQVLLNELGLKQPRNATAMTAEETIAAAREIGYPVILRPSYVLGGRGMVVVADEASLKANVQSGELVPHLRRQSGSDRRLPPSRNRDRRRCDLRRQGRCVHRRHHGAYRGSRRAFRRFRLRHPAPFAVSRKPSRRSNARPSRWPARSNVRGLMNVQYAVQGGDIFVLEVNPRASRTVPFVAKAIGLPVAAIAARVMAGETLASFNLKRHQAETHRGEGSRAALRALSRRRYDPRPRNALDRRSHGARHEFRPRLRQEPDRRRAETASQRHRLHFGEGCRQGCSARPASRR